LEDKVAVKQFSTSRSNVKRLTAQHIHCLTQETLQAHFRLGREGCDYGPEDIWDVLLAAAVEQTTVETMCDELEGPSANTVRDALKGILPDEEQVADLEAVLNEMLVGRLPKQLRAKRLPCASDLVYIPYHGQHEEDDEAIRRGRAKSGTTHFHCYATLYAVKNNKRYTLALTFVRRSDTVLAVLQRLLNRVKQIEVPIKRLMLDRGFDNNAIIAYLNEQPFPTIMALTIRGKQGGTRALLKGRKSHVTTYTRPSTKYSTETFTVHVACKYGKGRYKRRGLYRFAYIVIGELKMQPLQVYHEYRRRFGIETSYRLMNLVRVRTTSKSSTLRLFYVGLALTMLNLWVFVKWTFVSRPRRGGRLVLHRLLPLARWRLWLWEVVKQRQGLSMEISVPLTA
jgi:putative transposase